MDKKHIHLFLQNSFTPAVIVILWFIIARLNLVGEIFISSPPKVFRAGFDLIASGFIFPHLYASLTTFIIGLAGALAGGTAAGFMIGHYEKLYRLVKSGIFLLNALPFVAVIPLIVVWAGVGTASKIIVVFVFALIPIVINTVDGVRNGSKERLAMARSFGAKDFFTVKTLEFFEALPFIFSGLRLAVGRGVIGIVVAEMFGYGKGLGYLVSYYGGTLQTANLIAVILMLMLISLIFTGFVAALEKKVIYWKN